MAVHCSRGTWSAACGTSQIIGQREKLLALGTITAGLTHQLNNPAAATARAVADLREGVGKMRHKLAMVADGKFTPRRCGCWSASRTRSPSRWPSPATRNSPRWRRPTARTRSATGWRTTASLGAGTTRRRSSRPASTSTGWSGSRASVDDVDATASLQSAIGWLKYTIDNELLMNEIAEASKRISALLAGAKQYSQMDRGAYQSADVHELLHSTLDDVRRQAIGKDKPVTLVKDCDKTMPESACYPGDLNQVWTNIIDNAIQAMDGHGTLTIRTMRENDELIRVEICDDGPGIPEDIVDRIFTPFFTTKPFGEGTGLGLDLAWRIVVEKHHGNISVQSEARRHPVHRRACRWWRPPRSRRRRRRTLRARARNSALGRIADGRVDRDHDETRSRQVRRVRSLLLWQQLTPAAATGHRSPRLRRHLGGGSPPAELDWVEPILGATDKLQLATGIVNIWTAAAGPIASPSTASTRPTRPVPARHRRRPSRGAQEYTKPYRRADRVPRQARRVRRAEGPPRGGRTRAAGAQAVGATAARVRIPT